VPATTPVEEELRRFETHLEQVRGLAASTRRHQLRIVRCLLMERFGTGRIDLSAILPEQLRRFLERQQRSYTKPHSCATLISTLRSYLRFCVTRGEPVQGLMGVLVSPPNWRQAALPKALSDEEVARLVASLGEDGLAARRDAAIVRCALDLGLRRGEIAALSLDDIDWRDGTLTLRRTKGGRADTLPLPPTTGQAIADYLRLERTQTSSRALFVRCIAPQGRPLGPDGVAKAIRQAYARAGLTGHSAHALRHTLASRLLASGGSLKEVADVLRHRSLDTTLVYAKLDERSLTEVALPWPGAIA
jgi:site-specific recombinase XerD